MKSVKFKKVFNVLSYIFIGIVFTLSLVGIIIKANGGTLYLFKTRADVVLSGSMASKNEEHLDFLEGHDNQIQKMDLVFSKKVEKDEDIEVYDIVLYKNPILGTTMHRIVGKNVESEEAFYLYRTSFKEFNGVNAIIVPEWLSEIRTSSMSYTGFDVTIINQEDNVDKYRFTDGYESFAVEVTTTQIGDYYEHHISKKGIEPHQRMFLINHKVDFDGSNDYIMSVSVDTESSQYVATADKFTLIEENKYKYTAHTNYVYDIRGDALKDNDDGRFTVEDIYSKVTFVVPKLGYFVRFITSVYGMILLIGLGFITIGANFILERDKIKQQKQQNNDENK